MKTTALKRRWPTPAVADPGTVRVLPQLETKITFRILPNGEITDIKIVQPSGNRYLDESAYRAVRKASPVAPHPEGINQPYIEVGLRATPAGFR